MKDEMQPEGNYYDKYNTKNIIEQCLMRNFFRKCEKVFHQVSLENGTVLEAGCGEGDFTRFLYKKYGGSAELKAFDISAKCIRKAREKCPCVCFYVGSIYDISPKCTYDLVVASEVLEHLEMPEQAVDNLLKVSSKYLFLTIPNEPLWRILNLARGKYWRRLGNTPGHVQHWNKRSIEKLIMTRGGGEKLKLLKLCQPVLG